MSSKIGRPKADNPKDIRFSVRIDQETNEKLTKYCNAKKITKGKAIRIAIDRLLSK